MSDQVQLQNTMIAVADQAIKADRAHNYQLAYDNYKVAVEILFNMIHNEKNQKIQDKYKQKAEQYIKRAEEIQSSTSLPVPQTNSNLQRAPSPSAQTSSSSNKPQVRWSDVAGLEVAKQALKEAVILPLKHPEIFSGGRTPWKGILLYGPPGTGKSFLAKAWATESEASFYSIAASDIMSRFVGEAERNVRELFETAQSNAPAVIFIDEVDSMWGKRSEGENEASRRVKNEFLLRMDGLVESKGVLVLGATNLPQTLDEGFYRRFEKKIYIPLPDRDARLNMIQNKLAESPNQIHPQEMFALADMTEGFSGSDIATFIKNALMEPVRRLQETQYWVQVNDCGVIKYSPCEPNTPGAVVADILNIPKNWLIIPEVTFYDMQVALSRSKPTVQPQDLVVFENFTRSLGEQGS